nr:Gag-Pol polyprotein [Tanacetum cinerariifolium]
MFIYSFSYVISLSLYPFTERYAQPYFFSSLIRQSFSSYFMHVMLIRGVVVFFSTFPFVFRSFKTLCLLNYALMKRHDYDITVFFTKRGVTMIGLPKLKYFKDQLCSSCELSKAKRSSFKLKAVSSSKGRLNLLHMDLCGPMRVDSINRKKYILVIVDDYSRYTWTLFLRFKDETPEVLKDFLRMIQRNLQASEVIEFGDSYKAPTEETGKGPASESSTKKKGRTVVIITKDMQKRRNDVKAITTLLLALPDEHQNKDDLDTMSLDDVYNHLKVYEPEVQKNTQVSTASTDVAAASLSHDTVCAYIASQLNGSHIKYEDITQIDKDDIEEMDIKWNMDLLSEMRQLHKISHFAKECRAPKSQDRGKRESYKQGPKEEELAHRALMAIDGIGWDWSYMGNEEENHALVADDEVPTKFALMAKSSSSLEKETGLPEFVDDTVTDYSRPTPSIDESKCNTSNKFFVFEHGESSCSIMSKPMIKFVKAADCLGVIKTNKTKTARKSPVKYAEMYRNTSKSPKVRGTQRN